MVTFRSGADGVVGSTAQEGQSLAQEVQQLRQALASQPLIEQAKGMLMAQHGCTADEAFDMLREASMRANRKLRDLAAAIVQSSTDGRSDPSQDRRHLRCRLVPNDPDRVAAADRRDQQAAAREAALGRREARVADLIARAVERDQLAERRDRRAEQRDRDAQACHVACAESATATADREQSALDRYQSGVDRDASAVDRADLIGP